MLVLILLDKGMYLSSVVYVALLLPLVKWPLVAVNCQEYVFNRFHDNMFTNTEEEEDTSTEIIPLAYPSEDYPYWDGNPRHAFSSTEYKLYSQLLLTSNYSRHVRPVRNHLDPVIVKVGMCVMMIEDLIERDQTMVMSACVKMFWVDEYLRWDPLLYSNLSWLALGSQSIWLPDIAIVNSPEPHALTRKPTNIGVSHRGEVGFFPSGRLATRCNLIITYFPFDWQNCEVRFESWIYPTKYMIVELYPGEEPIDVKEYYDNFQWSLKSYRVETDVVSYDGKNFSSLTVVFRLRRKPAFYFMYYIFPQLLLAALQTLSHTLPVEHPGRMAMLTALFIGTSVTHAGIASHIPKSSDTMSLLQVYMTMMSVNLVLALMITFVMLYTVLRYPKHSDPSFCTMMIAFFQIVWPSKHDSDLFYEVNHNFRKSEKKKRQRRRKEQQHDDVLSKFSQPLDVPEVAERTNDKTLKIIRGEDDESVFRWPMSPDISPSASTMSIENFTPLIAVHMKETEEEPIWQINPDFCQQNGKPAIQVNGMAYFDGEEICQHHDADYDCAYSWRTADGSQVVPIIAKNHCAAHASIPDKVFYENPGFVLPLKSCKLCREHRMRESMVASESFPNGHCCHSVKINGEHSHQQLKSRSHRGEDIDEEKGGYSKAPAALKRLSHRRFTSAYLNPYLKGPESTQSNEDINMKKKWLMYCVALDKSIMYVNGVWNLIVPVVLFVVLPLLHDSTHGAHFDET